MLSKSILLKILLILTTFSYILEKKYYDKKLLKPRNLYIELISLIHHTLVMFSTGMFFLYPLVGLTLEILFKLHWVFNNDKCILSQIYHGYYFNSANSEFNNLITFITNKKYVLAAVVAITFGFFKTENKNVYTYLLLIYILLLLLLKIKYPNNDKNENNNLRNTFTRDV